MDNLKIRRYGFAVRRHLKIQHIFLALGIAGNAVHAAEAPAWRDFVEKRAAGNLANSVLPDFSFAGYHFSEKPLPDVSGWTHFSVVDYGAKPGDAVYDDDAIRAAIRAAEAHDGPAVVFFPSGTYRVSDKANRNKPFVIRRSHMVLKGEAGSEIFTDERGNFPWRFRFIPPRGSKPKNLAVITRTIQRGAFSVTVKDAAQLKPGQTVNLVHRDPENLKLNMPGKRYSNEWDIGRKGIEVAEKHLIEKIDGRVVTFKNPVQLNIPADASVAVLKSCPMLEEVGVEDLIFSSGWKNHPDTFVHHKNKLVDYAWRALSLKQVKNSWVKNCEFRDWNEVLEVDNSMAVTVRDITCSGKRGHSGYFARTSYGVLFENCIDNANIHHGPGMRHATVGTVFRNCKLNAKQSVDCHGNNPYCNLIENVYGGRFDRNGGALRCYPNGGLDLVFWNFIHDPAEEPLLYDFWSTDQRKLYTYPDPKFIGLQTSGAAITFKNEGLDELRNEVAYPKSLFEAQLQLRLFGTYISASSGNARLANDRDAQTAWSPEGSAAGQWLMLDFGVARTVKSVSVQEIAPHISAYKVEGLQQDRWHILAEGTDLSSSITIKPSKVRKLRFTILSTSSSNATVRMSTLAVE